MLHVYFDPISQLQIKYLCLALKSSRHKSGSENDARWQIAFISISLGEISELTNSAIGRVQGV